MQPTKVTTLLGVGLAAAPAGWLFGRIVQELSGALPAIPWVFPVLLVFMAALLLAGTRVAKGWIAERRYDNRVDALLVARLLVLGKAAAVFGAVIAGAYVGLGLLVLNELAGSVARDRALVAAAVAVAAVSVAIAGFRLELGCRVPPDESED